MGARGRPGGFARFREIRGFEITSARRESENVLFGQSTWVVEVRVDGRPLSMRLLKGEQAEWIAASP